MASHNIVYYSERPCPKQHNSPRYLKTRMCVECQKEHNTLKRLRHRDKILKLQLEWKARNLDHLKEYSKKYIKENFEKRKVNCRNYSAKKRGSSGSHTLEDVKRLLILQNYSCNECRINLDKYDVDHVIPLSRGGSNDYSNLQILCPSCNRSKNDKTMEEWREWKSKIKREVLING